MDMIMYRLLWTKSVTKKGIYIFSRQACLLCQGESHLDMGRVFGLCIFTAHQSGPWLTGRTPEDPLVQDSLTLLRIIRKFSSLQELE